MPRLLHTMRSWRRPNRKPERVSTTFTAQLRERSDLRVIIERDGISDGGAIESSRNDHGVKMLLSIQTRLPGQRVLLRARVAAISGSSNHATWQLNESMAVFEINPSQLHKTSSTVTEVEIFLPRGANLRFLFQRPYELIAWSFFVNCMPSFGDPWLND
jgi:hypothetical protein